jgi:hypothetical protein
LADLGRVPRVFDNIRKLIRFQIELTRSNHYPWRRSMRDLGHSGRSSVRSVSPEECQAATHSFRANAFHQFINVGFWIVGFSHGARYSVH